MPLSYNGNAVTNVTYNSNEVSNVYYNSTKVYTSAINIKFSVNYSGNTTCTISVPYGFTSNAEMFHAESACFNGSTICCRLTQPGNLCWCYNKSGRCAHFRGFDSSPSKCFCTPSVAVSACIVGEDPSGLSVTIDNIKDKQVYEGGSTTIMISTTCYCARTPAKHVLYYCCNALDNTLSNASKKIYDGCIVLANRISSDVDINTNMTTIPSGRVLINIASKRIDFDSYVVVIRKDGKVIYTVKDVNLIKLDGCSITIPSEYYK